MLPAGCLLLGAHNHPAGPDDVGAVALYFVLQPGGPNPTVGLAPQSPPGMYPELRSSLQGLP